MNINWQDIRSGVGRLAISTKTMIGSIATGVSIMQIQEARDFVIKHTVAHPRIATIAVGILGILTLLHNPTVQKILHIAPGTPIDLPAGTPVVVAKNTDATVK